MTKLKTAVRVLLTALLAGLGTRLISGTVLDGQSGAKPSAPLVYARLGRQCWAIYRASRPNTQRIRSPAHSACAGGLARGALGARRFARAKRMFYGWSGV